MAHIKAIKPKFKFTNTFHKFPIKIYGETNKPTWKI